MLSRVPRSPQRSSSTWYAVGCGQGGQSRNPHGAFDGLRLVAAVGVLFSHSYALLGQDAKEPLVALTGGATTIRELGVYAFFAISGYLVAQSWTRDPSASRFMIRRGLRILPALAFVIIVSVAIIGPLTTTLTLTDYFSSREAWTYLTKVLIYPTQYGLPGTFEHNPFPRVVNGSLWSLRVEFVLYLAIVSLGLCGLLRRRPTIIAIAAFCVTAAAVLTETDFFNAIPFHHQVTAFFLNAAPFFIGAFLAQDRFDARLIAAVAAIFTAAAVVLIESPAFKPMLIVALPLAVILVGRYGKCDLRRFGDYSYGIYLFAFPVQQSVIHFFPGIQPAGLTMIAGAVTFCCAAVSWHLIEKRALALKPRRSEAAGSLRSASALEPANKGRGAPLTIIG